MMLRSTPTLRLLVASVAALAIASCGDQDAAPPADGAAVAPGVERGGPADPSRDEARAAAEVRDYRLTMDRVRRYADATEAFYRRAAADPGLRARMDAMGEPDTETIDQTADHIGSVPEWRREIERAGLTPRDYVLTMASLTAAAVHVGMREFGWEGEQSEWASDHNIAFFEENRAEIERVMERLQQYAELFDDEDDGAGW
jgi:hypothetical protein